MIAGLIGFGELREFLLRHHLLEGLDGLVVLLESGDAFVGCMAHNGVPFRLSPGLPIFAEDLQKVRESWKILIDQGAKMIYPAHGGPFSVEKIQKVL